MFSWLKELFSPSPKALRDSMRFVGRARWIVHLFNELGEDNSEEFGPPEAIPGYEDLLVFAFAPVPGRPWWTYATAGMSLCPALDAHPPTELIAYSREEQRGLVSLLFQLALRDATALPLAGGDIICFDEPPLDIGIELGRALGVLPSAEAAHLLDFPNPVLRSDLVVVWS